MILNTDEEIIQTTKDNLPITGEFLSNLGFVGTGQKGFSNIFVFKHNKFDCQLDVFYHYNTPEHLSVLSGVYPDGTLIVRTHVVDPYDGGKRVVNFSSQAQLEYYVEYLEKSREFKKLQHEISNIITNKIFPSLKC